MLTQLFIYPIKSVPGISLSMSQVKENGLLRDRQWMLVDEKGGFISLRKFPQLARLEAKLNPEEVLQLSTPTGKVLELSLKDLQHKTTPQTVKVWSDTFQAEAGFEEASAWFSAYLEQDVQLVRMPQKVARPLKNFPDVAMSFADSAPFLLINKTSLDTLSEEVGYPLEVARFRPNLVLKGAEAFSEERWKTVHGSDVAFEVIKPCGRCIVTTQDPKTGVTLPNQEPLRSLSKRRIGSSIPFGVLMRCVKPGVLRVGEELKYT